ncbi:hypothetical protein N7474_006547 [Penicillium riverlandense]|uniref:uncharacterized protein n=1 Tax=Penicillium riverlandense TaxID=1903569 RepID=UPI0025480CF9|nr:uncharacterized protein N7474_006547 [Penicillium riverlandense]KAJ5814770.1 hypothetical protein N7474_006547 [Penicillium riverlandense]
MGHVTVIPPSSQVVGYGGVDWHLSADIESDITTLAAICQVNQPQRTPLGAGKEEKIHDDYSGGDERASIRDGSSTNVNACLTGDDTKSIKMVFLDRLAELLCYKKHAHYVTCTSLLEGQDEITIFAARNATWEEKDRELLESLANMLELIATGLQNGFIPDADEDNWIFLGFCTARNNDEVRQIVYLYRALLGKCEFEEFWMAMEGSSMVDLFKKNGLGHAVTGLRNFEALMSIVSKWYQSVWELKRFTRLQPRDPMRVVVEDYGFCNCQTPQERIELQRIYTKFFAQGGDAMALHEACIKGQLKQFLESELGDLPFPAELVSNPYPLKRCEYMGMVVGTALLCAESMYEKVMSLQKETVGKGMILTFPDEYDESFREGFKKRAEFLRQGLTIRTTSVQGENIISISGL